MLADPRWRQLIVELATQLDDFAQDALVRDALLPLPLVACGTTFLPASSCYFASETVTAVLGAQTPAARPFDGHERSTTSLYEWLGVPKDPQLPDVVTRARQLPAADQDPESRRTPVLHVRYRLPVFSLTSDEVSLKALYVPAERADRLEDQLISCPHDGRWPWMLIAKELARALYPGELPGPLASSL